MSDDRYVPQDREKYERLLKFFSNVQEADDLKTAMLLFIMDISYPRADIIMAERVTKKTKGWR